MFTKIYEMIKKYIYSILLFLIPFLLCIVEFPYYIESPGGIIDISKKIDINTPYQTKGSLNMAYVSEYKATIPTLLIAAFNREWDIKKQEQDSENTTDAASNFRNHILLDEANYNAERVALSTSNTPHTIHNVKLYITYIFEETKTNLKIGDIITEVNGNRVISKEDMKQQLRLKGSNVTFTVIRENQKIQCTANWISYEGSEILGIAVSEVGEIKSNTGIKFHFNKNESGPSGGLMMTLAIYNALTEADITKGRKIVGTGTIDEDGNVGEIDGVSYKLKAAIKANADIFLVPAGRNYEEAIEVANKNKYDIPIYPVSTFTEALQVLNK